MAMLPAISDKAQTHIFRGSENLLITRKLKNNITATITICPASSPILKLNKGIIMLSFFASINRMVFAKPIPCISPKNNAIKYCIRKLLLVKSFFSKLMAAAMTISQELKDQLEE
jgi:hypothetical protein